MPWKTEDGKFLHGNKTLIISKTVNLVCKRVETAMSYIYIYFFCKTCFQIELTTTATVIMTWIIEMCAVQTHRFVVVECGGNQRGCNKCNKFQHPYLLQKSKLRHLLYADLFQREAGSQKSTLHYRIYGKCSQKKTLLWSPL